MQIKVSYFGKKMPQKTIISKEEKCEAGFKAGRSRITLQFYANAVSFMIRTALMYKADDARAFKGKEIPHIRLVVVQQEDLDNENLFLDWFH